MLEKEVGFRLVRFPVEAIEASFEVYRQSLIPFYQSAVQTAAVFARVAAERNAKHGPYPPVPNVPDIPIPEDLAVYDELSVTTGDTRWRFNSAEEFFSELRQPHQRASVEFRINGEHAHTFDSSPRDFWVDLSEMSDMTVVTVRASSRATIAKIMAPFEAAAPTSKHTDSSRKYVPPRVFVGHGGKSLLWRDLKDHLRDQHGYDVEDFESGARAGHTIRDVLEEMLDSNTFAILVMTGEDAQSDGTLRARQNVVHEAGLFQGRLGFPRTVILLEEGTDNFSNLDGVQYIPFAKGNIREAFGDVLATLRREFPMPEGAEGR